MILAGMGIGGSLLVADRQDFAEENAGTYSLGTAADVLEPHFNIYEHRGDIADPPARVDANELPWPQMVLSTVDSIDARHHIQRLWADHHIDIGTACCA